ncbi:MAG: hypothetical protein CSB23_02800 [Deltaproteobacteria bacterium]|nr:MAG: hypothetical protein CSB23_02800 [Deltaproteobacteria bacterium]
MNRKTGKKSLQKVLALGLALVPCTAWATAEVDSPEIVVTATKTEKLLQDVPATVTIVDGDTAARYGNDSIADMVRDVPGVEVFDNNVAGSKRLMIRGRSVTGL